jgi:hypothetical protein
MRCSSRDQADLPNAFGDFPKLWAASTTEFVPPYAPGVKPVEYLRAHWKHHELANFRPRDFAELSDVARAKLRPTQRRRRSSQPSGSKPNWQ